MGRGDHQERLPVRPRLTALALTAGLLVYSQLVAYSGNESFHLLAAKLINAGKHPYRDFFYQHAPLYAYLTAAWMRMFGESWRSAHVLSALLLGGCAWLVAGYVLARLNGGGRAAAIIAALFVGMNFYAICFGTAGLPFGLCLFLMAAAYRLTTEAVNRQGNVTACLAGLCAAAAAASSLLTAPAAVIFLLWMMRYNRAGSRLRKCAGYLAGAAIPFRASAPADVFQSG
jgi:hypothetical protein